MCVVDMEFVSFFFFNDTATTEIYTLSLHDALPIFGRSGRLGEPDRNQQAGGRGRGPPAPARSPGAGPGDDRKRDHGRVLRSEEHTSELQSRQYLVCRLLLEKKKT